VEMEGIEPSSNGWRSDSTTELSLSWSLNRWY